MCKNSPQMHKELKYNKEIFNEIDEDHFHISNTYSAMTIMNAKNPETYNVTNGCLTSIYTQDLNLQHEDRFLLHPCTLANLKVIRYQNPTHRYTSNMIIPPDKVIHNGMVRLIENTLAQISNAFIITVFGGTYLTNESEYDTIGDKFMPFDDNVDRGDPVDLGYIVGNIQSFEHEILVFNHFGRSQQYKYFLEHPFKRTCFFDEKGNINNNFNNLEQYSRLFNVSDDTEFYYDPIIIFRAIREFYRKGYLHIILNIKYNLEGLMNDVSFERFNKYFTDRNINVKYQQNSVIIHNDNNKYKPKGEIKLY
jgi:hypothetical protein